MRPTPEQKEAFRRADNATSIVKRSRGQWCIRHQWQDLEPEGIKTETQAGFTHTAARQARARHGTIRNALSAALGCLSLFSALWLALIILP